MEFAKNSAEYLLRWPEE